MSGADKGFIVIWILCLLGVIYLIVDAMLRNDERLIIYLFILVGMAMFSEYFNREYLDGGGFAL